MSLNSYMAFNSNRRSSIDMFSRLKSQKQNQLVPDRYSISNWSYLDSKYVNNIVEDQLQ